MIVAVAILGIVLGGLYRVAGGATRTVAVDEKTVYAVELARSLLALHSAVPPEGLSDAGETDGGFSWRVLAEPLQFPGEVDLEEGQLQTLRVAVSWVDGEREREFALDSVVAGLEQEE